MEQYLKILALVTIGVILLWFGYILLVRCLHGAGFSQRGRGHQKEKSRNCSGKENTGNAQACPVCSTKLNSGELVSSAAFPSLNSGKDRLMHIRGCIHCLDNSHPRNCPVCGAVLGSQDILVARMFDRRQGRSHVHIVGCNKCRKTV